MKFCFFGYDYSLDIAVRLIADGHELIQIFTFPCDQRFSFNREMKAFAAQKKIPLTETKPTRQDIENLKNKGVTLFLAAGYMYKIPYENCAKTYGINVHPALLPQARGIMPLPYVIAENPSAAGFTMHKLTDEFDAGDILHKVPIRTDEKTDIETLSSQIAIHCPDEISKVIADIERYWKNATPQNQADAKTYPEPSATFRGLNWDDKLEKQLLKGRAFGRFGVLATIRNRFGEQQKLAVYNFSGWQEKHSHENGKLLRASGREIVVAVPDGYLCLKEFQILRKHPKQAYA